MDSGRTEGFYVICIFDEIEKQREPFMTMLTAKFIQGLPVGAAGGFDESLIYRKIQKYAAKKV